MKNDKPGDWGDIDGEEASASRSRTSEVYARIRHDVISGRLTPGSKLKIEQLRGLYGVGATPVREALSYLAADGLVVREDQKGFRVAEISGTEFEELLRVRCFVEERSLRLAIEQGGDDWEETVVVARHRLLGKPREERQENEWERRHKAFHMGLISACGSNMLLRLANQLYDENNRYRYIARFTTEQRDVQEEHEQIAEAALARNGDHAVRLLVEHYSRTGELLRAALDNLAGGAEPGRAA
jgi:DNA-binding GntR family transcriptional regulator